VYKQDTAAGLLKRATPLIATTISTAAPAVLHVIPELGSHADPSEPDGRSLKVTVARGAAGGLELLASLMTDIFQTAKRLVSDKYVGLVTPESTSPRRLKAVADEAA
jgi:hypothetical protein